ncbi:MAG TPA: hypothetical protein VFK31_07665 [Rhodanobacteraceae bacterium]|nr:hypothetical protein [Rhodanobacteraceae bacterium]
MNKWLNKQMATRAWLTACLCCLPLAAWAGVSPAHTTSSAAPTLIVMKHATLEQAVAKVQSQTHGKVLRAGTRQYGNMTEYLIKVLTPDGHVRVIPVRSKPVHTSDKTHKETH